MEMHSKKREQLQKLIREGLTHVQVTRGRFAVRQSLWGFIGADDFMNKHGKEQRELQEYVDDSYPIIELVSGFIQDSLVLAPWIQEETASPLSLMPGYQDLDAIAAAWTERIAGLPHHYAFTVKLPKDFLGIFQVGGSWQINSLIRLFNATAENCAEWPLHSGNWEWDRHVLSRNVLAPDEPEVWEGNYLQIREHGYVTKWASTMPRVRMQETLSSVLGLAMVFGVVTRRNQFQFMPSTACYCHAWNGVTWFLIDKGGVSDRNASLIEDLVVPAVGTDQPSQAARVNLVLDYLWNLQAIFDPVADAQRIQNAARWYFDAEAGTDPLLRFVQMMVVLEILYGDKELSDKIGLGELLRNRCAYAIGQGSTDRDSIITEFKAIYNVRSAIVHSGKARLSAKERALFNTLSEYCRRAIYHEASLLKKDREERNKLGAQAAGQPNLFPSGNL